jgi:putative nucleotidyltransferase with HDIG domain
MKALKVIFIDDQVFLLNAIERIVRKAATNWDVRYFDAARSALAWMEENPVDVVVTDMRMPLMDGVQFLDVVRLRFPNVIRFILSGCTHTDRTLDAIRVAHQYFVKPFSTRNLIEALELTHTLYKRIRNPGLQGIIASVDRIPTPRRVFYEISEALDHPDSRIDDIAQIIERDTGVSSKVLQVVNSAFFGQSNPVMDIREAVAILGYEAIRSLVLIVGIASDHKEVLGGLISIDLFSDHCMEVARYCRWMGKQLGYSVQDQNTLFTIGLLHDIGRLLIIKKYAELYTEHGLTENPYTTKLHISQFEKLAEDHAGIGAALIALWGLPPRIVNTIAFYPTPESAEHDDLHFCRILHIGDAISNTRRIHRSIPDTGSAGATIENLKEIGSMFPIRDWIESMWTGAC